MTPVGHSLIVRRFKFHSSLLPLLLSTNFVGVLLHLRRHVRHFSGGDFDRRLAFLRRAAIRVGSINVISIRLLLATFLRRRTCLRL